VPGAGHPDDVANIVAGNSSGARPGIGGYLLKSVDRRELVSAIRGVHFSPDRMVLSISRESMAELQGQAQTMMSGRETDILRLVAEALSNGQIATRLHISEAR
jgi:DNA-binding NarL/FixJ family response regulator